MDDGGLFQPTVHYLPELFRQLTIWYPESPLLSVLRPLLAESDQALIATAAADYEKISLAATLTDEQRRAWLEVFYCWLMARLDLTPEEIQRMIAQLPDIEETRWGRQLKERWTAEARADQLRQTAQRLDEDLKHYEELFRNGVLPDAAYRDLAARAAKELEQCRADLANIESRSR